MVMYSEYQIVVFIMSVALALSILRRSVEQTITVARRNLRKTTAATAMKEQMKRAAIKRVTRTNPRTQRRRSNQFS